MKAVWNNNLEIERNEDKLIIKGEIKAQLNEAYEIQSWINNLIKEIEIKERNKYPIWKRIIM